MNLRGKFTTLRGRLVQLHQRQARRLPGADRRPGRRAARGAEAPQHAPGAPALPRLQARLQDHRLAGLRPAGPAPRDRQPVRRHPGADRRLPEAAGRELPAGIHVRDRARARRACRRRPSPPRPPSSLSYAAFFSARCSAGFSRLPRFIAVLTSADVRERLREVAEEALRRRGRIPRRAGRRRWRGRPGARTARAPRPSGPAGTGCRRARSCRRGTRPRPAAGRRRDSCVR